MNFDLFEQPHPHPLMFIEEGKKGGEVVFCSRCHKELNPPAFSCSVCNFHLHQSCIDHLPPQIQSRFHPQHTLHRSRNNYICNCCRRMPSGEIYECTKCGFQIDIKCALVDTKQSGLQRRSDTEFRHFSHPHPLVLILEQQEEQTGHVVCLVCELLITSGSIYFCSRCDFHFHKECAELPREIENLDYHPHPLFLFPEPLLSDTFCGSCKNECTEFYYCCPQCNFNLHISCLSSNLNHKHTFTKFRNKFQSVCQACGKMGTRFSWFCISCHLLVHKECAELPLILRTSGHRLHDLNLTYFRNPLDGPNKIFCKICNEEISKKYAGYGCNQCNYFAHLDCAGRQRIDPWSIPIDALDSPTAPINGDELENDQIPHFSHKHNLSFSLGELEFDKRCDGCMQRLSSPSYGCAQCDFFLHKDCVKLPRSKTHFLHNHPLALISFPDFPFHCNSCLQYFHGFAYHCEECHFTLDIRCASIKIPFNHSSHEHPLSHYRNNEERNCDCCGQGVKNKTAFRCVDCNFYLDSRCATLPLVVRYRFDTHPLNLTFVDEEGGDEFYCDVCEEERDPDVWFYSCRKCCFAAHTDCILGEFPYMKTGIYEGHSQSHPLRLVMKKKKKNDNCGACNDSCGENLAFECGRCSKFNVHAIGACYHRQLVQAKLTFTMRCFYSPAIGLYGHPFQKNGRMRITLGPYGGKGGSPWEEKVFSRITKLVVYHGQWIDSIQIQYMKNGNSLWSEMHGASGGSKSQVYLDYPNEYLVSIHGHYSNLRAWRNSGTVIRSLTIVTNKNNYGPFGVEKGTKFSFPATGVKFVGIHGSSGQFLDSIGLRAVSIQQ